MVNSLSGLKIHVSGIVQGVGFRPFVYALATSLDLNGWVCNTSSGVDIEVVGASHSLDHFLHKLKINPPVLARIDSLSSIEIPPFDYPDFSIRSSSPEPGQYIPISPDYSICPDCQREVFDPGNRRFRYPFINCTNCGPRFTIIRDIPYDRPNTTMSTFPMCERCSAEFHDPLDRRFHAQPIACPDCGPKVSYFQDASQEATGENAIQAARQALSDGKILAIKGLGGYHLACDASNQLTVNELRRRKNRSDKPFALMAFDITSIEKYVDVTEKETDLLHSPQHPIVLLHKNSNTGVLDNTAPNQDHLGFMLPYTPLHLLLCEPANGFPDVLVMTSGNISEEPIAYDDQEAAVRLSGIADAFLTHNRAIHMRVDDSVTRIFENKIYPLRRSRGYAPDPLSFPLDLPQILACGAELKSTFAISRDNYIFVSHHIGDLENYETLKSYEEGTSHYKSLYRLDPQSIAVDLHPDYLSTKYGVSESQTKNLPLVQVQHHHAHLAACLADNKRVSTDPVIGLIFDGTGYGTDEKIWGGEVLVGGYSTFQRRFHLQETPLPGGDNAIRNPAKIAMAQLLAAGVDLVEDLPPLQVLSNEELNVIRSQISTKINTPLTTSMGRLFDAVSSLIGIRHHISYEGQAAIELENLCDPVEVNAYEISIDGDIIHSLELIPQILKDFRNNVPVAIISARFHNSIAQTSLECCRIIKQDAGINSVALSGGVWQNMTLLKKTATLLRKAGFEVLIHHQIPANDGGISVGQILVAASKIMQN